jgi:hypothetical protein
MEFVFITLFGFALGAAVGVVFRRNAILSLCVTIILVLCIHLTNDYMRSGFPPITPSGVAVSLGLAWWALVLFGLVPALMGALVAIVSFRLISRRQMNRVNRPS